MKKPIIKGLVICLVVCGVGAGGYYGYKKFFAAAQPAKAASSYMTVTAKKMNMQVNVQSTGSAYAGVSKDVMPNNNGTITDLNLKVGDTVKAGTKLFTADSDQLRQAVTKAENDLQKQQLQLSKAKTDADIQTQNLAVSDAQSQVDSANTQLDKMTVYSPIDGVIVAENNNNGDSVQSGKAVLTISDLSSMKIKVAVDELDIEKVKNGQKAEITFDAIKDKTFDGTVETVSPTGTSSNNVTTYDVVVAIKDPANIKIGMNANVNILVDSKENAVVVPTEALVERNGNKYVMIPSDENAASSTQSAVNGQSSGQSSTSSKQRQTSNGSRTGASSFAGNGKLVQIKTGLVNENYVEVLEGITEGQKVLVSLPKTTSGTSTNNNKNSFGGGMGSFGGSMNNFGGNAGGSRNQQGTSSGKGN